MKAIYYTLPVATLAVGLLLGAFWFAQNIAFGSVAVSNEYNAVQLTSADIGSSSVKTISGSVGSIVVASTSESGAVNLYYISSSTATTATSSNTLLFSLPANVNEGTYTYDVSFSGGLLIDVGPSFNGDYVMTWR